MEIEIEWVEDKPRQRCLFARDLERGEWFVFNNAPDALCRRTDEWRYCNAVGILWPVEDNGMLVTRVRIKKIIARKVEE